MENIFPFAFYVDRDYDRYTELHGRIAVSVRDYYCLSCYVAEGCPKATAVYDRRHLLFHESWRYHYYLCDVCGEELYTSSPGPRPVPSH